MHSYYYALLIKAVFRKRYLNAKMNLKIINLIFQLIS